MIGALVVAAAWHYRPQSPRAYTAGVLCMDQRCATTIAGLVEGDLETAIEEHGEYSTDAEHLRAQLKVSRFIADNFRSLAKCPADAENCNDSFDPNVKARLDELMSR